MASSRTTATTSRGVDEETEKIPDALVALWARARPSMLARVQVLARAVDELDDGGLSPATREEAVREAHKLAGSLGTYGLMSGSRMAREVESRLEKDAEGDGEDKQLASGEWLRLRVGRIEALIGRNGQGGDDRGASKAQAAGGTKEAASAPSLAAPLPVAPQKTARRSREKTLREGARSDRVPESVQGRSPPQAAPSKTMRRRSERPGDAADGRPALARFLSRVLQELEDVEAVVASSIRRAGRHKEDPGTVMERQQALHHLETVAGWLQEVGIDLPARRARELAGRLKGRLQNVEVTRVAEEVLTLRRMLERLEPHEQSAQGSRVLVVSPDRVWAQKTRTALEVIGHRVEVHPPGGLPVHPDFAGIVVDGVEGVFDTLESLGENAASTPVVYAVKGPDPRLRVEAGRFGADRVVERGVPARELCGVLSDLLIVSGGTTGHVLLVDDDETVLQAVEATLRHAGFDVETVQGPEGFWRVLEETSPDLVITDLDMPGMDGAALTLAMRTDARWVNLPVVFLSSKDDHASLRRVFEAGADDFVPKPLRPELLLARVRARLARSRSRSATGHLDPVTRLPVGAAFEHALDDLVQSADRSHKTLTVAVLRLDATALLRDRLGLMGLQREEVRLAQVIAGHVEPPAMVGRRETDRFVLVLPESDPEEASGLIRRIVESFAPVQQTRKGRPLVTVSAGLAQCGVDGRRTVELVAAAEAARVRAEEAGGSQLFIAGRDAASRRVEEVDVLVVDDDPTIGELLVETLTQKGWHVAWEPDSERAVDRLSGPERDMRARVVLLDVNMPGMDGLTVLRLLRENQVMPPARVIMLTVRAREDEVVRALNMGASDHVAKPFSVPVLMTRVQRVLGEAR